MFRANDAEGDGLRVLGLSYQEKAAPPAGPTFILAIVFVFLLLAAMYESWRLPWAVLLGVPAVALGAFFGVWLMGYDNNVYVQIGLVMLIGLAAKNAILIVEFAKAEARRGDAAEDAALESARLRFRPILMTAFAFILGVVPLMLASGAGAASQNVMGTAVFWGMLVATALGVFLIPGNYTFVETLRFGREEAARWPRRPRWPGRRSTHETARAAPPRPAARSLHAGPRLQTPGRGRRRPTSAGAMAPGRSRRSAISAGGRSTPTRRSRASSAKVWPTTTTCGWRRRAFSTPAPRSPSPAPSSSPRCAASPARRISAIEGDLSSIQTRETFAPAGGLDFGFELDFWGRFRRGTEAARAELLFTEFGRRFVITTLVSDLSSAYFSLRALDVELEIARRTLDSRTQSLHLVRVREEGGVAGLIDVRQSEILVAGAAQTVPDIERQIEQTENLISILLGRAPAAGGAGPRSREQVAATALPAGVPARLLERRPDVQQAEQVLASATARIGVARSDYFPRVFLSGAVQAGGLMVNGQMFGPQGIFSVLPSFTLPSSMPAASAPAWTPPTPARTRPCCSTSRPSSTPSAMSRTRSWSTGSSRSPGSSSRHWWWPPSTPAASPTCATTTG